MIAGADVRRSGDGTQRLAGKAVALVAIAALLVLGIVGLVFPLIPGIIFLALAAAVAARYSRSTNRYLRRNRTVRRYLDDADRVLDSDTRTRLKLGALYSAKAAVEGAAAAVRAGRRAAGTARSWLAR